MREMIIILSVMLYVLIGAWIFNAAVNQMGGKAMYLEEIAANMKHKKGAIWGYYVAYILLILFWPWFIIKSIFWRKK